MQRKQRTTIITHANIKKEVDSQLNPYVKKTVLGSSQVYQIP